MKIISISIFGVLGVLTRYSIDTYWNRSDFPYATLGANLIGCFIAGFLFNLVSQKTTNTEIYLAMIIGFCGGLTTFSSYALQSFTMIESKEFLKSLIYLIISPALGLLAIFSGIKTSLSLFK